MHLTKTVTDELVTRPVSLGTAVGKKTACLLASARHYRIGRALYPIFISLLSLLLQPSILIQSPMVGNSIIAV